MKPWYQSKTVWFNVVSTALPLIAANTAAFQSMMTPARFAIFCTAVTVGNIALRAVTATGITFFKPE